jgi:hypothetical protein
MLEVNFLPYKSLLKADILSVNPLPANSPYARSAASGDLPLGAWVAGGVCFGLGTNYPCRICPRLPATTDLLDLAGTRR